MKKILLPLFAVGMCVAPAFAQDYGTTPETAKPMPMGGWFVPDPSAVPSEVWFTMTSNQTTPAMWGDGASDWTNPVPVGQQVFVYLCNDGQEAFQMTPGTDSYVLFPGKEYLVKITPKVSGFYCMNQPMALKPAWEGLYKYYPVTHTNTGSPVSIPAGETRWFLMDMPFASMVSTKDFNAPSFGMFADINLKEIEVIHIECPGGTNVGTGIMAPYAKAGQNVIGITAGDDKDAYVLLNYDPVSALNCGNRLLNGKSLELNVETTYPDAYYTVDRYFTVPEDGSYTFINHGADGTILNVGMVKVIDPTVSTGYECDWTNIKSATVGNGDATIVVDNLKAGDKVLVQSDAFGVIGEGPANLPYLKVVKGNQSGIADVVAEDGNTLKATVVGGKLNVESVLLASGAEVAVYDMLARKVASAVAADGAASLEINLDVNPGVYVVVVYGKGNSESAKIAVK